LLCFVLFAFLSTPQGHSLFSFCIVCILVCLLSCILLHREPTLYSYCAGVPLRIYSLIHSLMGKISRRDRILHISTERTVYSLGSMVRTPTASTVRQSYLISTVNHGVRSVLVSN